MTRTAYPRHLTIPVRRWFRLSTICVYCDRVGVSDDEVCGVRPPVLCKHCGQPLDVPPGQRRGLHAAGRQQGRWRCDEADSGLPYGYSADPVGQPCGGSCLGASELCTLCGRPESAHGSWIDSHRYTPPPPDSYVKDVGTFDCSGLTSWALDEEAPIDDDVQAVMMNPAPPNESGW